MAKNPDPRDAEVKGPFPRQDQPHPGSEAQMRPRPDFGEDSYKGLGRLEDRVAIVTGGDSGIGRAVCLAFAREGADVVISYLNEHEDAKETRRVVEAAGRKALTLAGDLSDVRECQRVIDETVRAFGRVDILVNNAAFQGEALERFEDLTPERIERTFKTNIIAMFHLVRFALSHMKPGATIINVGSIQAYKPAPPLIDYAATKGAIVTFTKGLAQELAGRGIRANCVAPGPVWTPIIPTSFGKKPEDIESFGQDTPLGRAAQPAELAPSFVFLASDESRYITGEVLGVTGGKPLA